MKQLLAKTLCVAGLLTAVSAAHAGAYNLNVTRTSGLGAANTGWSVSLYTSDNITWDVLGIQSLAGANMAAADANVVSIAFLDDMGNQIDWVSSLNPATSPVVGPLGGPWLTNLSNSRFESPDSTKNLKPSGATSTLFKGQFTLDPSLNASTFVVNVQGSLAQWSTSAPVPITPEMPAGVLLLAALVPVGLIARRRMGATS
jgi:hypothetical protein